MLQLVRNSGIVSFISIMRTETVHVTANDGILPYHGGILFCGEYRSIVIYVNNCHVNLK